MTSLCFNPVMCTQPNTRAKDHPKEPQGGFTSGMEKLWPGVRGAVVKHLEHHWFPITQSHGPFVQSLENFCKARHVKDSRGGPQKGGMAGQGMVLL